MPNEMLFTRDALIAWLRTQPPDEEYIWQDPVFCLMGHFLADNGSSWGEVGYSEMPSYREIAETKPWTYGAALARAEALKQLPPPMPLLTQESDNEADAPVLAQLTDRSAGTNDRPQLDANVQGRVAP
jgi:hypothetical protein